MYTSLSTRNAQIIAWRTAQKLLTDQVMRDTCATADVETCIEQPPRATFHEPRDTNWSVGHLPPWHLQYDRRQDPRYMSVSGPALMVKS